MRPDREEERSAGNEYPEESGGAIKPNGKPRQITRKLEERHEIVEAFKDKSSFNSHTVNKSHEISKPTTHLSVNTFPSLSEPGRKRLQISF